MIFLVLLAIRLPVMLSGNSLTMPELNYMLIGEKLNQGASLYEGIWDNIAPISAFVYASIDFMFGRSQLTYQVLALFLVAFQCLLFNKILIDSKAYNENTYIPGLIYGLLMSFFFDFLTLTPVLMGITFLLLALENIFSHIEFRAKEDEKILNIGLFFGLAYLFYLPNIVFGVAGMLVFVLFTGTIVRRYILMIFGFLLPLLLTSSYFLLSNRLGVFIYNFLDPLLHYEVEQYMSLTNLLIIFSILLLYLLLSLLKIGQVARFNNYQSRLAKVMFIWLIFSVGFVLISGTLAPNTFMIFIPAIAFFISHYLLLFKKRWVAEIVFSVLFASVILLNLGTFFGFFFTTNYIDYQKYTVNPNNSPWDGQKILILDYDFEPYAHAEAATPFLNWQLSEALFRNPDYYDNLTIIQQGFSQDLPEVIIDKHGVMPPVFDRLPQIKLQYTKRGNIYYLKPNS